MPTAGAGYGFTGVEGLARGKAVVANPFVVVIVVVAAALAGPEVVRGGELGWATIVDGLEL